MCWGFPLFQGKGLTDLGLRAVAEVTTPTVFERIINNKRFFQTLNLLFLKKKKKRDVHLKQRFHFFFLCGNFLSCLFTSCLQVIAF